MQLMFFNGERIILEFALNNDVSHNSKIKTPNHRLWRYKTKRFIRFGINKCVSYNKDWIQIWADCSGIYSVGVSRLETVRKHECAMNIVNTKVTAFRYITKCRNSQNNLYISGKWRVMIENNVLSLMNDRAIRQTQNNRRVCANDSTPCRVVQLDLNKILIMYFFLQA